MTQNQEEYTSLRSKEQQNNELECIEGGTMIKLNTILPLIHCFAFLSDDLYRILCLVLRGAKISLTLLGGLDKCFHDLEY
jgi:hypothetical protein